MIICKRWEEEGEREEGEERGGGERGRQERVEMRVREGRRELRSHVPFVYSTERPLLGRLPEGLTIFWKFLEKVSETSETVGWWLWRACVPEDLWCARAVSERVEEEGERERKSEERERERERIQEERSAGVIHTSFFFKRQILQRTFLGWLGWQQWSCMSSTLTLFLSLLSPSLVSLSSLSPSSLLNFFSVLLKFVEPQDAVIIAYDALLAACQQHSWNGKKRGMRCTSPPVLRLHPSLFSFSLFSFSPPLSSSPLSSLLYLSISSLPSLLSSLHSLSSLFWLLLFFKELLLRGALHGGDSDSTGSIAGSWYGALFGFDHVPQSHYQNLEYRDILEVLGLQLFELAKEKVKGIDFSWQEWAKMQNVMSTVNKMFCPASQESRGEPNQSQGFWFVCCHHHPVVQ